MSHYQSIFLFFFTQLTLVYSLYDIDKFSIQPSSYFPSAQASYSLIFNVADGIPAGLELQIILPPDYLLDKSNKVFSQTGYPASTYMEGFTNDPDYIISVRLDSAIAPNTVMNLTIKPMKNQNHNRYYQPITFAISNWVAGTEVRHIVDPFFRLKDFGTAPTFTVTSTSYKPNTIAKYSLNVISMLPGFRNSRFTYQFPDGFGLDGSSCKFDPSVLLDSTCEIISASRQVILKTLQDIPAGEFNLVMENVLNPTTIDITKDYTLQFMSLDFEGVVIEKKDFTFSEFTCDTNCQICDATKCQLCQGSLYLYQGSCYEECPLPSYLDPTKNECSRECVTGCSECVGSKTKCTDCEDSFYFFEFSCLTECPANYTVQAGACVIAPIVVSPEEQSTVTQFIKKHHFENFPVITIYVFAGMVIWSISSMFSKEALNTTAFLIALSLLEPVVYLYLLALSIVLQDYFPICLFSFLATTKITLQLLFSTVELDHVNQRELVQVMAGNELKRLCFLRVFEYCYNFKLCYLRESKFFGLSVLSLTRFAQRKLYINTKTVLKANFALGIFAMFGYFGYFLLHFVFAIRFRTVYVEGGCFILIHALLDAFKLFRMNKFLSNFVIPLSEPTIEVGQSAVVPLTLNSARSNHSDHSNRLRTQDDTSMMQRFHNTGDTSRLDIEKSVMTLNNASSITEINSARSVRNRHIFALNLAAIEEYQVEKGQEEDSLPTFDKDKSNPKDWGEVDSTLFGAENEKKEKQSVDLSVSVSKEGSHTERCVRSSEGGKRNSTSFGTKLRMLSDSFVKSLANLACKY